MLCSAFNKPSIQRDNNPHPTSERAANVAPPPHASPFSSSPNSEMACPLHTGAGAVVVERPPGHARSCRAARFRRSAGEEKEAAATTPRESPRGRDASRGRAPWSPSPGAEKFMALASSPLRVGARSRTERHVFPAPGRTKPSPTVPPSSGPATIPVARASGHARCKRSTLLFLSAKPRTRIPSAQRFRDKSPTVSAS